MLQCYNATILLYDYTTKLLYYTTEEDRVAQLGKRLGECPPAARKPEVRLAPGLHLGTAEREHVDVRGRLTWLKARREGGCQEC